MRRPNGSPAGTAGNGHSLFDLSGEMIRKNGKTLCAICAEIEKLQNGGQVGQSIGGQPARNAPRSEQ
jgi:hypothetical protein